MRCLSQRESYVFVLTQTRVFPNFFTSSLRPYSHVKVPGVSGCAEGIASAPFYSSISIRSVVALMTSSLQSIISAKSCHFFILSSFVRSS